MLLYQFLVYVFWSSVIRCVYIEDCFVLLMNWPFYHYEMAIFIAGNIALTSTLCDCNSATVPFFYTSYLCVYNWSAFLVGNIYLSLAFCNQSDNFHLLIGVFRPYLFNVIIGKLKFKCMILLFIFYVSHRFIVSFSFLPSFGLKKFLYNSIFSPLLAY